MCFNEKVHRTENMSAMIAHDGIEGLTLIDENNNDSSLSLIILDVMMQGMDGFQVLKKIREISNIPVLMLTAKSDEEDKVFGLRIGADDYLTKPFSINELMARVNSLVRRYKTLNSAFVEDTNRIMLRDMTIDKENRSVSVHAVPVELTSTEFDLLLFLASNKGRIFTKKQIYTQVWEDEYAFDDSNIMSFISKLRKRLSRTPTNRFIFRRFAVLVIVSTRRHKHGYK